MDVSDSTEKKQPGKFWHGLLLSLACWAVDAGLANIIFSWGLFDRNRGLDFSNYILQSMRSTGYFVILLAWIWFPIAVIASYRSWKKGLKATLTLVLITFIIAPILVGCGFGLLYSLWT